VRVRLLIVFVASVLALPSAAHADPRQVKPDRAAIDALLDKFIPAVVEQKDLKAGWDLTGGVLRVTSRKEWLRGNTSVQAYPAKGTRFHGYLINYSYPGDVGFDILLQPTKPSLGAWSFRAEAQKLGGKWKITTWYPVAEYAPPGQTQRVNGPADLGAGGAASASASESRLGAWVLAIPVAFMGALIFAALAFAGTRWWRRRKRVRAIERSLASDS
jgi:hypothetical protein